MSTILLKRGNNANLASLTLAAGEAAFVLDTGKLVIGDGTNKIEINPDITPAGIGAEPAFAKNTAFNKNFGIASGTVCQGNDSRLSDARNPLAHTHTKSQITDLTLGTAAACNTGTASGNVPILDANGKLNASVVPAIAIGDTFVVASESAMLALSSAEVGDIAVRTDLSKSFILKTAGYSTLANWQELLTPASAVTSVAGKTGAVTLAASDVGLGNVTNESKNTMFTSPAFTGTPTAPTATANTNTTQLATTAFVLGQAGTVTPNMDGSAVVGTSTKFAREDHRHPIDTSRAPLASPAFTGTPTAPTAAVGTNTTQIATTAFVMSAGFLKASSDIDGGTF